MTRATVHGMRFSARERLAAHCSPCPRAEPKPVATSPIVSTGRPSASTMRRKCARMPAWAQPATARPQARRTPQSAQSSVSGPTGTAGLTFLQPLMRASASVAGASNSSLVGTVRPPLPSVSTQTRSHMR